MELEKIALTAFTITAITVNALLPANFLWPKKLVNKVRRMPKSEIGTYNSESNYINNHIVKISKINEKNISNELKDIANDLNTKYARGKKHFKSYVQSRGSGKDMRTNYTIYSDNNLNGRYDRNKEKSIMNLVFVGDRYNTRKKYNIVKKNKILNQSNRIRRHLLR